MGKDSKIAWCKSTFNPWIGCSEVSPACDNCYAREQDHRWGHDRWGEGKPRTKTSESYWKQPHRWNAEAAKTGAFWPVFCASLADICEDRRDLDPIREDLKAVVRRTQHLTWLFLSKRPELYLSLFGVEFFRANQHVWAGTTVESGDYRYRIDDLSFVPSPVRWLSVEPQLGPVDLRGCGSTIQWAISGFESGPNARAGDLSWARLLRDQCAAMGVAFFMKQLGSRPRAGDMRLILNDRNGADPAEWPEDLRVQQFPLGLKLS